LAPLRKTKSQQKTAKTKGEQRTKPYAAVKNAIKKNKGGTLPRLHRGKKAVGPEEIKKRTLLKGGYPGRTDQRKKPLKEKRGRFSPDERRGEKKDEQPVRGYKGKGKTSISAALQALPK